MGHTERIIVELTSLDEAEQARLLVFVKARAALAAALAPCRVALGRYRFDREAANAR